MDVTIFFPGLCWSRCLCCNYASLFASSFWSYNFANNFHIEICFYIISITLIVARHAFKNARSNRQLATFSLCNMLFVLTMATALHGTSTWFALGNGSQKATMHGTLPSHDAMTKGSWHRKRCCIKRNSQSSISSGCSLVVSLVGMRPFLGSWDWKQTIPFMPYNFWDKKTHVRLIYQVCIRLKQITILVCRT